MSRGSVLSKENVYFLFYILQCIRIFFTGADFYDSVNIVYKDLAIADMSGIQNFLCSFDDLIDRNAADYHFYFYFWKQGCIDFNTTVFLAGTFLNATAHNLCNGHTGDTQIVHSFSQFVIS